MTSANVTSYDKLGYYQPQNSGHVEIDDDILHLKTELEQNGFVCEYDGGRLSAHLAVDRVVRVRVVALSL